MERTVNAKGITLIELIIATLLLSVVVLTAASVDLSARRFLTTSLLLSQAQNEASFALEHIYKKVRLGIGSKLKPGIEDWSAGGNTGFKVMVDRNNNGRPDDGINNGIGYRYQSAQKEIRFVPNLSVPGSYEVIAKGITAFNYTINGNQLNITLTATRNGAAGSIVRSTTLETGVLLRQMSWN